MCNVMHHWGDDGTLLQSGPGIFVFLLIYCTCTELPVFSSCCPASWHACILLPVC